MSSRTYIRIALGFAALLCCGEASAQAHPERRHVRAGNRDYEAQDNIAAEKHYRAAMGKDTESYEARFNLADALYRQERFEEAAGMLKELSESPGLTPEQRSKVFYNLGNTQFSQQKLQDALESYKMSQRLNPDDLEAKYNLAYTKKLLEQQQNNQDQNQDGQNDQNNQDNQDNQNQQDGDNRSDDSGQDPDDGGQENRPEDPGDGGDDENNGNDRQDGGNDEKPEPSGNNPRESTIDREDAEKMLGTIQEQEDRTREKVNAQRAMPVGASGKNW